MFIISFIKTYPNFAISPSKPASTNSSTADLASFATLSA